MSRKQSIWDLKIVERWKFCQKNCEKKQKITFFHATRLNLIIIRTNLRLNKIAL